MWFLNFTLFSHLFNFIFICLSHFRARDQIRAPKIIFWSYSWSYFCSYYFHMFVYPWAGPPVHTAIFETNNNVTLNQKLLTIEFYVPSACALCQILESLSIMDADTKALSSFLYKRSAAKMGSCRASAGNPSDIF